MWPSKQPLLKTACGTVVAGVVIYVIIVVVSQIVTSVPPRKNNLPYLYPVSLLFPLSSIIVEPGRNKIESTSTSLVGNYYEKPFYPLETVRTSSCNRIGKWWSHGARSIEYACFPFEACKQWYSSLNDHSTTYNSYIDGKRHNDQIVYTWPACQWKKQPIQHQHQHLLQMSTNIKDKWIPVSVCCPKPSFSRKENPVRTLTKSLYELPIKKIHVTLAANKRRNDEYGHCGKVLVETTPGQARTREKSHFVSFAKARKLFIPVISSNVHLEKLTPLVTWTKPSSPRQVVLRQRVGRQRVKRLVGGTTTNIEKHPWMASIWYKGMFQCGGTIIHQRVILTAAHCFPRRLNDSFVEILVASTHLGSGVAYKVSKVIIYSKYKEFSVYDDIALVVVKETLQFGPSVFPVCLPKSGMKSFKEGFMATLIGYGSYFYGKKRYMFKLKLV